MLSNGLLMTPSQSLVLPSLWEKTPVFSGVLPHGPQRQQPHEVGPPGVGNT